MTCRSCGATIADKALVCYRCGVPTAVPTSGRPGAPPFRWPAIAALVVFIVLLAWLAVTLPAGSVERTIAIGGTVVAAGALIWRLVQRR
jgi:hypothetical protein